MPAVATTVTASTLVTTRQMPPPIQRMKSPAHIARRQPPAGERVRCRKARALVACGEVLSRGAHWLGRRAPHLYEADQRLLALLPRRFLRHAMPHAAAPHTLAAKRGAGTPCAARHRMPRHVGGDGKEATDLLGLPTEGGGSAQPHNGEGGGTREVKAFFKWKARELDAR